MKSRSRVASAFITFVAISAVVMVGDGLRQIQPLHGFQFVTMLFLAVLASRMKVKLPGLDANMSINLPFILVAVVQLSFLEALLVGLASSVAQSLPKRGGKPKPVQMLFNISTMTVAAGLGKLIFQNNLPLRVAWPSGSLLLGMATAAVFLLQTLPVATIIFLTEGGKLLRIWSGIFQLSFPYYVVSAGITSMVTTASSHVGWQIGLLIIPVMYAIYRSFQLYFGRAVQAPGFPMAKRASTT